MLGRRLHPPNAVLAYIYSSQIGWLPTWQTNAQMTLNLKSSSLSVPAWHPLGMLGRRRYTPDAVLTYIYPSPIGWGPIWQAKNLPSAMLTEHCPGHARNLLGMCSEHARNLLKNNLVRTLAATNIYIKIACMCETLLHPETAGKWKLEVKAWIPWKLKLASSESIAENLKLRN